MREREREREREMVVEKEFKEIEKKSEAVN